MIHISNGVIMFIRSCARALLCISFSMVAMDQFSDQNQQLESKKQPIRLIKGGSLLTRSLHVRRRLEELKNKQETERTEKEDEELAQHVAQLRELSQ
jgi:hypothetical protein